MEEPVINIDLNGIMDSEIKALAMEEIATMNDIIRQLKETGYYLEKVHDPEKDEDLVRTYTKRQAMNRHAILYRHVQELAGYPLSERNYIDPWNKSMGVRGGGRFLNFMAGLVRAVKYILSPAYRRAVREMSQAAQTDENSPVVSVIKTEPVAKDIFPSKEKQKETEKVVPFPGQNAEREDITREEQNEQEVTQHDKTDDQIPLPEKSSNIFEAEQEPDKKKQYRERFEQKLKELKEKSPELTDEERIEQLVRQHYQNYYSLNTDERTANISKAYIESLALETYKKEGHEAEPDAKEKDSLMWKTIKNEIQKHPEVITVIPDDQTNRIAVAAARASRSLLFLQADTAKKVLTGDVFFESISMTGKKGEKEFSEDRLKKNIGYLNNIKEQSPDLYNTFTEYLEKKLETMGIGDVFERVMEQDKEPEPGPSLQDVINASVSGPLEALNLAVNNSPFTNTQPQDVPAISTIWPGPELHQENIREDDYNKFTEQVIPPSDVVFTNTDKEVYPEPVTTKEGTRLVEGEVGDALIEQEKERVQKEAVENLFIDEIMTMDRMDKKTVYSITDDDRFSPRIAAAILLKDPEVIVNLPDPEADGKYDPSYDIEALSEEIVSLIKGGYERSEKWNPDIIKNTDNQEVLTLEKAVLNKLEEHNMDKII